MGRLDAPRRPGRRDRARDARPARRVHRVPAAGHPRPDRGGGRRALGRAARGGARRRLERDRVPGVRPAVRAPLRALRRGLRDRPPASGRRARHVRRPLPRRRGRAAAADPRAPAAVDGRRHRPAHAGGHAPVRRRLEHVVRRVRQHARGLRGAQPHRGRGGPRGGARPRRDRAQRLRARGARPRGRRAPPRRAGARGSPERIADGLRAFAAAGADEAILVVSPISERSIRHAGRVVRTFDGLHTSRRPR